ncbi:hypothetical protein G4B88_017078 [Cannabis sativa]|uniref:Ubiquitin-like protease family profile domain-containing protein n=1 Tax=Cannabis sativa TaxID=3483 RepID=A0A7J6EK51_CANSA|nr:hypothetical protein G4B88_017078 [Cannabis sativa]
MNVVYTSVQDEQAAQDHQQAAQPPLTSSSSDVVLLWRRPPPPTLKPLKPPPTISSISDPPLKPANKDLKLRNITPTSVERLSLSLTDFFSGETTPDVVKFKIKGGSKPAGQPGLMGASSSSAHENVSRVEFEEFKKCLSVVVSQQGILMKSVAEMNKKLDILIEPEQSQGGEENIDVDATIASAVKAVENLIGSSTHVPASVETSEKTDLEMVVFQETPILRPQKKDRKKGACCSHIDIIFYYLRKKIIITSLYEKFVEKNNDISVLSLSHNVAQYIQGDFKGLRNEAKFSTMEPFPIVVVDGLPEQVTADCGVFVASFAEYFIDGKPIPSSGFDVEIHRNRLAVLFYQYGMKKQTENIESESEAPPSLPKNFSYPTSFNIQSKVSSNPNSPSLAQTVLPWLSFTISGIDFNVKYCYTSRELQWLWIRN